MAEEENTKPEDPVPESSENEPETVPTESDSKTSIDSKTSTDGKSDQKSDSEYADAQEVIEKPSKQSLKSNLSYSSNLVHILDVNPASTQTDLTFPPPNIYKKSNTPIEIDIQTSITCLPTDSDSAILKNLIEPSKSHLGYSLKDIRKTETTKSFLPPIDLNESEASLTESGNNVRVLDMCKTPLEKKLILTINHLANEMHSLKMIHEQFLPPDCKESNTKIITDHIEDIGVKPMYDTDLSASVPKIPSDTFDSQYIKPEFYSFPMYDVDLSSCGEGNNHICNVHCRVLYQKIHGDKPKYPPIEKPVIESKISDTSVYEEAQSEAPFDVIPFSTDIDESGAEESLTESTLETVTLQPEVTESEVTQAPEMTESEVTPLTEATESEATEAPEITESEVTPLTEATESEATEAPEITESEVTLTDTEATPQTETTENEMTNTSEALNPSEETETLQSSEKTEET